MIVGNAMLRSYNSSSPEANSLNFRCLDVNGGNSGVTGAPGTDSNVLPSKPCAGGIRSQIIFPSLVPQPVSIISLQLIALSCWDGVNIDSSDHKVSILAVYLLLVAHLVILEPCCLSLNNIRGMPIYPSHRFAPAFY